MSRVAKNPVQLPQGVQVQLAEGLLTIKGAKGELSMDDNRRFRFRRPMAR